MRKAILTCVLVASAGGGVVNAQLSFEVASIRPSARTQPAPLPSSPDQLVTVEILVIDDAQPPTPN